MATLEDEGQGGGSEDSDDEDYQPGAGNGNVSDNDVEEKEWKPKGKASSTISKKNGKSRKRKRAGVRQRNGNDDESEESDDLSDEDYILDEKDEDEEVEEEEEEDPEVVAAREKAEKERIDNLWLDFKSDVELLKTKGGDRAEVERVVTKTYEFAGQTVKVQEKVKGPSSKAKSKTDKSNSNIEASSPSSPEGSETDKKPYARISFLSGNPADIGLTGGGKNISAREALSNVLNALKARNKKLGTLDKTKLDWEAYKRDQNIEEEMEIHRRSRHGYIDKQEFLHRSDLRQFELEKAARTKRRRTMQ